MIMIIAMLWTVLACGSLIFGLIGFLVFINKMVEADNIKQGLKMLAFAILSLLSGCAIAYVLKEIIEKIYW